jgi:hypothetical protein
MKYSCNLLIEAIAFLSLKISDFKVKQKENTQCGWDFLGGVGVSNSQSFLYPWSGFKTASLTLL